MPQPFSIVIPARNEADGLESFLPKLAEMYPDAEIIVVNDGSTDATELVCRRIGVKIINHPYSKGNGASIKSGARAASHDLIVFMDGDGQHRPQDISRLLLKMEEGYDMVVGARQGLKSQASIYRGGANALYNRFASWVTEHKIEDLTSGFRAVRADKFREFVYLLPNGFSYPTTSTMAFFRAGYSVAYIPITAEKRIGKSHLKLSRDGIRFLLIIFKIGTLYSPLKVFFPVSVFFFLIASFHYGNTFLTEGRFTNMAALLYITSLLTFLMGLISEQITGLMYNKKA
jgi:glycosyltransferase involved in cell wall biosynthesis